jgi:hypothetical protein
MSLLFEEEKNQMSDRDRLDKFTEWATRQVLSLANVEPYGMSTVSVISAF